MIMNWRKMTSYGFLLAATILAFIACGGSSGSGGSSGVGSGGRSGATSGMLDTTFNTTGIVTTPTGTGSGTARAVAIQPSDGKIVAAGPSSYFGFTLVRYNTDGSLDTTFNTTGIVTTPIGTGSDIAYAVAIQPADGKIVAAGTSYNGSQYVFTLVRYNTDGSLDTTFNTTGMVTTPIGTSDDEAYAVAIQTTDGKIVAAGYSQNGSQYVFALVRYNTNGSLDTTFNTTGIVTTPIAASSSVASAVAIQPTDGKIVAAGSSNDGIQNVFALVRYNTNGSLDTTFNTTGIVTTPIGTSPGVANAVAIQPTDGKIVAAGYSYNVSQEVFALVRYNTNGSLDTTFNTTGIVTTPISTIDDYAYAVAIQPKDGKIVAAGYSFLKGVVIALVRYNTDGSLDTTFNTTGIVTTPLPNTVTSGDEAFAVTIQPKDGKIVAAGYSNNGSTDVFTLVRYLP